MKPKFLIGGLIIAAVIVTLMVTTSKNTGQYYLSVEELLSRQGEMQGKSVRISGVVLDNSITYDPQVPVVRFEIAHIPSDMDEVQAMGGLEAALKQAATDLTLPRLWVTYQDIKPDLLQPEAQAILTGTLGADGVFYADELLLKCPSKYEAQ